MPRHPKVPARPQPEPDFPPDLPSQEDWLHHPEEAAAAYGDYLASLQGMRAQESNESRGARQDNTEALWTTERLDAKDAIADRTTQREPLTRRPPPGQPEAPVRRSEPPRLTHQPIDSTPADDPWRWAPKP